MSDILHNLHKIAKTADLSNKTFNKLLYTDLMPFDCVIDHVLFININCNFDNEHNTILYYFNKLYLTMIFIAFRIKKKCSLKYFQGITIFRSAFCIRHLDRIWRRDDPNPWIVLF